MQSQSYIFVQKIFDIEATSIIIVLLTFVYIYNLLTKRCQILSLRNAKEDTRNYRIIKYQYFQLYQLFMLSQ